MQVLERLEARFHRLLLRTRGRGAGGGDVRLRLHPVEPRQRRLLTLAQFRHLFLAGVGVGRAVALRARVADTFIPLRLDARAPVLEPPVAVRFRGEGLGRQRDGDLLRVLVERAGRVVGDAEVDEDAADHAPAGRRGFDRQVLGQVAGRAAFDVEVVLALADADGLVVARHRGDLLALAGDGAGGGPGRQADPDRLVGALDDGGAGAHEDADAKKRQRQSRFSEHDIPPCCGNEPCNHRAPDREMQQQGGGGIVSISIVIARLVRAIHWIARIKRAMTV